MASHHLKKALRPTTARLEELRKSVEEPMKTLLSKIGELFYKSKYDMTRIRREAGASEWDLTVFKRALGITAGKLIRELRLEVALWLLRESSLSVEEIAGLVGYEDKGSLERLTGNRVGCTPGEARKRLRQEEPEHRAGADLLFSWYFYVRAYRGELAQVDLDGPLVFLRGRLDAS